MYKCIYIYIYHIYHILVNMIQYDPRRQTSHTIYVYLHICVYVYIYIYIYIVYTTDPGIGTDPRSRRAYCIPLALVCSALGKRGAPTQARSQIALRRDATCKRSRTVPQTIVCMIQSFRGNHLSNTTCLTQVFFKRGEQSSKRN